MYFSSAAGQTRTKKYNFATELTDYEEDHNCKVIFLLDDAKTHAFSFKKLESVIEEMHSWSRDVKRVDVFVNASRLTCSSEAYCVEKALSQLLNEFDHVRRINVGCAVGAANTFMNNKSPNTKNEKLFYAVNAKGNGQDFAFCKEDHQFEKVAFDHEDQILTLCRFYRQQ